MSKIFVSYLVLCYFFARGNAIPARLHEALVSEWDENIFVFLRDPPIGSGTFRGRQEAWI